MSTKVPDQVLENIMADMIEGERLKTLTNRELVQEYFCSIDDGLIVDEMIHRLDPEFMKEHEGH